jgi:hypothetical protein
MKDERGERGREEERGRERKGTRQRIWMYVWLMGRWG